MKQRRAIVSVDISQDFNVQRAVCFMCVCVRQSWKSGGERKGGRHDKSVSVMMRAKETSCRSFQSGSLCSQKRHHKASHTRTMKLCLWSSARLAGLLHIHFQFTRIHNQNGSSPGADVMGDSSGRQSRSPLWWPLSLTSSWAQFISLSARLIWPKDVSVDSTIPQYPRTCPSLIFCLRTPLTWYTSFGQCTEAKSCMEWSVKNIICCCFTLRQYFCTSQIVLPGKNKLLLSVPRRWTGEKRTEFDSSQACYQSSFCSWRNDCSLLVGLTSQVQMDRFWLMWPKNGRSCGLNMFPRHFLECL